MPESYVKGKALFIYFSLGESSSSVPILGNVRWGRLLNRVH
jgi:hypothetical protein